MLAPKGFTQQITKDAYIAAHRIAQEKNGILRFTVPCMLLIAALSVGGIITLYNGAGRMSYILTGEILLLLSCVLAVLLLVMIPKQAKKAAQQDYISFAALSDPAEVTFESDEMLIKGEKLSRRVEYAKTRLCIETAERFVILTDDEAMVILEKACFCETDATVAFLRDVFARWYVKK